MQPEQTKHGVFVPLPLFEAMARCYYGGGSRDRLAPEVSGEPAPRKEQPSPSEPLRERTEEPLVQDLVITRMPGWKPRGVAARTMNEPPPPEPTDAS